MAQCEETVEQKDCDLGLVRQKIQQQIVIDLEAEEIPLRKEVFELTVKQLDRIPHSQFKLLEKDYLRLKHQFTKVGLEFRNAKFDELRQQVDKCVQKIKSGDLKDVYVKEVDFEHTIADRQAQLYAIKKSAAVKDLGRTQLADD